MNQHLREGCPMSYLFSLVGAMLALPLMGAGAFAQSVQMIQPGTPQAATAAAALERALEIDRMNAKSYDGSDLSSAATYYAHKAKEVEALANRLQNRQPIASDDLRAALDTSHAIRYTGGY